MQGPCVGGAPREARARMPTTRDRPGGPMSSATTELTGQVAVITGAGRGIGRALGARLAAEGMKVGLVARTGSEVDSLRDEIVASGGQALSFAADVADRAAVERIVAEVEAEFGG